MEFKQNFDRLSRDVREYIELEADHIRLVVVERLSFFLGDILSWVVIMLFAFMSLVALLVSAVVALSSVVGYVVALTILSCLLFVVTLLLFAMRRRLFVDFAVRHLCRLFFEEKESDEKE